MRRSAHPGPARMKKRSSRAHPWREHVALLLSLDLYRCAADLRREARAAGRRLALFDALHDAALLHRDELACCSLRDSPSRKARTS
jgi:hypothetical protein